MALSGAPAVLHLARHDVGLQAALIAECFTPRLRYSATAALCWASFFIGAGSSGVLPEIKEYERTSTTVINSYVRPVVEKYLSTLTAELARVGVDTPLLLMQSNGGLTTARAAAGRYAHEKTIGVNIIGDHPPLE